MDNQIKKKKYICFFFFLKNYYYGYYSDEHVQILKLSIKICFLCLKILKRYILLNGRGSVTVEYGGGYLCWGENRHKKSIKRNSKTYNFSTTCTCDNNKKLIYFMIYWILYCK